MTERDGYFYVSGSCIVLGAMILLFYIWPIANRLNGALTCAVSDAFADRSSTHRSAKSGMEGQIRLVPGLHALHHYAFSIRAV